MSGDALKVAGFQGHAALLCRPTLPTGPTKQSQTPSSLLRRRIGKQQRLSPPSGRRQRREPIPEDWRRGSASETNEDVPVVPSVLQNVETLPKGTVKGALADLEESVVDAL
ncbi:hypothetical protein HK097_007196 [Rhizophlyctis rosea]|uniref:Uncharacterized protein n=1 Tax=Rhizophlyctis rosea TaxID=64517 RepID=A0AAD5SKD7_9FUNG|nr:hypothetical protein HK097_007196 [Rhizophlyctis rosea]